MNVRDSELIIAQLKEKNYTLTNSPKDADLILINTCSVRERPVQKLFSEIGQFNKQKKKGAKIGVCGCSASHLGEEIIKRAPYVDFVLGARNVSKITQVLDQKKAVEVDINSYDENSYTFGNFRHSKYKALINISIGCDKECSFCIVPHTRGKEISIPPNIILDEVKRVSKDGAKEILLLGQNVNNYGKKFNNDQKKIDFSDLLEMISEIEEVKRIRFTSPHPLHMDDKFLNVFANNPKICKSIHMPLQSGSNKILKDMKRGYTKEWFLNRAQKIRDLVKNVRISTDIIVGFPGESESDFQDSLEVIKEVKFEQIFSFKYSPRPLTQAAKFENQVDTNIASRRLKQLQDMHSVMVDEMVEKEVGNVYEVYFEELRDDGFFVGRSDNNYIVLTKSKDNLLGQILPVKITDAKRTTLYANLI